MRFTSIRPAPIIALIVSISVASTSAFASDANCHFSFTKNGEPIAADSLSGTVNVSTRVEWPGETVEVIQLDIDNTPICRTSVQNCEIDTTNFTDGQHSIRCVLESRIRFSRDSDSIKILNPRPAISLQQRNGSSTQATYEAQPSADSTPIEKVIFSIQGTDLTETDTSAPFLFTFPIRALPFGSHTLEAVAVGVDGLESSATTRVINDLLDSEDVEPVALQLVFPGVNKDELIGKLEVDIDIIRGNQESVNKLELFYTKSNGKRGKRRCGRRKANKCSVRLNSNAMAPGEQTLKVEARGRRNILLGEVSEAINVVDDRRIKAKMVYTWDRRQCLANREQNWSGITMEELASAEGLGCPISPRLRSHTFNLSLGNKENTRVQGKFYIPLSMQPGQVVALHGFAQSPSNPTRSKMLEFTAERPYSDANLNGLIGTMRLYDYCADCENTLLAESAVFVMGDAWNVFLMENNDRGLIGAIYNEEKLLQTLRTVTAERANGLRGNFGLYSSTPGVLFKEAYVQMIRYRGLPS